MAFARLLAPRDAEPLLADADQLTLVRLTGDV